MKRILLLVVIFVLSMSVRAQQGVFEYKMTMSGEGRSMSSTNTMYFRNGDVRIEATIPIPSTPKPMKQTMLMLADKPHMMYSLDERSQTYVEVNVGDLGKASSTKSTVKVLGKEKIRNLNTTHVEVTVEEGFMEIWTTKDVPGYEKMLSYWRSNKSFGGDQLLDELKKNGADGFIVGMKSKDRQGKDAGIMMELVRYDAKPVSAALFQIPKDYKKRASFNGSGITPEQRKKLTEAMKKRE